MTENKVLSMGGDLILGSRMSGKTTGAIGWLLIDLDNRALVVSNKNQRDGIFEIAVKMLRGDPADGPLDRTTTDKLKRRIVSFRDVETLPRETKIGIDNAEMVLSELCRGHYIEWMNMSVKEPAGII